MLLDLTHEDALCDVGMEGFKGAEYVCVGG